MLVPLKGRTTNLSDMEKLLATWEIGSRLVALAVVLDNVQIVARKLETSFSLESTTGSGITETVRRATVKLP